MTFGKKPATLGVLITAVILGHLSVSVAILMAIGLLALFDLLEKLDSLRAAVDEQTRVLSGRTENQVEPYGDDVYRQFRISMDEGQYQRRRPAAVHIVRFANHDADSQ